jgi:hypothetical protein
MWRLIDVNFTYLSVAESRDSSVGIALGWTVGILGFDSRRGLGTFLFTTASRTALGPTQPPIQWVRGSLSLGVKRPGCEADHSPPPSAEVKNAWSYTSIPQYAFMVWCSVKAQDKFTLNMHVYTHYDVFTCICILYARTHKRQAVST